MGTLARPATKISFPHHSSTCELPFARYSEDCELQKNEFTCPLPQGLSGSSCKQMTCIPPPTPPPPLPHPPHIDNECQTVCSMIHDHEIVNNRDMPKEVWDY